MRSKVKIDINHKGEPVIRVTVPEPYKANPASKYRQETPDDLRDKLVQRFVWPADQVKKHTAFDGIASQTLIRRGYPCIIEHFHENDYIIKPLGTDVEDLEMLKKYIDTLIRLFAYSVCEGQI